MISVEEAQARILCNSSRLSEEQVYLLDATGRVLARDLRASIDLPPFDNSSMDGYAIHAGDSLDAHEAHPIALTVDGLVQAGHPAMNPLPARSARKIMTGAPLPPEADAVVAIEEVERRESCIVLHHPVKRGSLIRQRGQDTRQGATLLAAGTVLNSARIGLLASQGVILVPVTRKPRVAILATGDELVEPGQTLLPGQIPNSNSYALSAAVMESGGIALRYPAVADRREAVAEALRQAASEADIVLSSGGVSVGDYDLVKSVLQTMGQLDFWRVDMKPGKPLASGFLGKTPFLGLPGNPVSALVTFELFARPLIRSLLGDTDWPRPVISLPLAQEFSEISDRRHYVRVAIRADANGALMAWPTGPQDSHLQTSWTNAQGLMIIPPHQGRLPQGSIWPVMLLKA